MRIRPSFVAFAGIFFSSALALAQAAEPAHPGPEVEKLGYFSGAWEMEGEMPQTAEGPAGKASGRQLCRWMPGKFFVTCRLEHTSPAGTVMAIGMMGYDLGKKVYTSASYDSLGRTETATGRLENGTWTWTSERAGGGKNRRSRIVMSNTTLSGYDVRREVSESGKSWKTVMTGKVVRHEARKPEPEKKEPEKKETP